MQINNYHGYSFEAVMGMIIIGIIFTTIGTAFSLLSLFKGEIVVISHSGRVIIREKIKEVRPLRFSYLFALVFTLLFGPGTFLIGTIGLITFISTQVIR